MPSSAGCLAAAASRQLQPAAAAAACEHNIHCPIAAAGQQ